MQRSFTLSNLGLEHRSQGVAARRALLQLAVFLGTLLVLQTSPCVAGGEGSVGRTGLAQAVEGTQMAALSGDETGIDDILQPLAKKKPPGDSACSSPKSTTSISDCVIEATLNRPRRTVIGEGGKPNCTGTIVLRNGLVKVPQITINTGGTLVLSDDEAKDFTLESTGIDINGGSLLVGSAACPIGTSNPKNNATFVFTGPRPDPKKDDKACGALTAAPSNCPGFQKGIQVEAGGKLKMYGYKGVATNGNGVSWTYLSQAAGDPTKFSAPKNALVAPAAAATVIYTTARVDGDPGGAGNGAWRHDDWIAVATTSFSPWETEFVQVDQAVKNGNNNCGANQNQSCGSKVTLQQALRFYHFGGPAPDDPSTSANYTAGSATNYGVDERAEVGLITRNIILTSDSDETPQVDHGLHWGGEIRILKNFAAAVLQGVELQKFGKEQIGGYPVHFHQDGDLTKYPITPQVLIDSNSIDHSYNKCITTHSTSNLGYSNNVCARITGHIFYEEVGDEYNVTFKSNVGMGAMSNSFDVNATMDPNGDRKTLIKDNYWVGDNMTKVPNAGIAAPMLNQIVFDQFKIFDTDNQQNSVPRADGLGSFITVRGTCGFFNNLGIYINGGAPNPDSGGKTPGVDCYPTNPNGRTVYFEPPTGFWLLNPSAKVTGNSVAGCQDTGSAYWYITPPDPSQNAVKFIPIGTTNKYPTDPTKFGTFQNNRGHGCYRGLVDENFEVSTGDSLFGYENALNDGKTHPLVGEFDGLTLSRIRYRGVWLRPEFYYIKDGRFATIDRGLSFVTSGGADGNYPGVWSLLSHSTIVGMSQNNVDRFGPCGSIIYENGLKQGTPVRGGSSGCIDVTRPTSGTATGGEFSENGYPTPNLNLLGFMSYDGPPLLVQDRFVNFQIDPTSELTTADQGVLSGWNTYPNGYKHYEGDAAIGWLDSNQSAYPTAAMSKQLSFTNVDLRHEVYTDKVNLGAFNDGDKNTSIVDLDGTLGGYGVGNSKGTALPGAFAISLNNLPFNASSNSVDECRAEGQQNVDLEGRDTAAMVPSGVGQLEFESLYPNNNPDDPNHNTNKFPFNDHSQLLTFYKDTLDFNQHGSMDLHSRNGLGVWEPKVTSGYGYVVRADPYNYPGLGPNPIPTGAGIGSTVDVSVVDTVMPSISTTNPFYIQLGICYKNQNYSPTTAPTFTISHGYRSWAGGGIQPTDLPLRSYFNRLINLEVAGQNCNNLDAQNNAVDILKTPCPTDGVSLQTNASCPGGDISGVFDPKAQKFMDNFSPSQAACKFPKDNAKIGDATTKIPFSPPLTPATSMAGMTTDGTLNGPPNLDNYFYDADTGMLYLWIAQVRANAVGPSPLGNCTGSNGDDPFCPQNSTVSTGESYYNCPPEGCPSYRITINDSNYKPGVSSCPVFGSTGDATGWLNGTGGNTWTNPPGSQPALVYTGSTNVVARTSPSPSPLPHYAAATAPTCPVKQ